MVPLVFVHGWGSGPMIWKEMIPVLETHYDCHVLNLGFIGQENLNLPFDGKFIGIGHSLGGLWLLKHHPDRLSGFISIASFNCFYAHIPKQILTMMQKNIIQNTLGQLTDFWQHAGLDQPDGLQNLNALKLLEGLGWLSQWQVTIPDGLPLLALASRDDLIVPQKMSAAIWQNYPLIWRDDGGHMLPLTRTQWCLDQCQSFIKSLEGSDPS